MRLWKRHSNEAKNIVINYNRKISNIHSKLSNIYSKMLVIRLRNHDLCKKHNKRKQGKRNLNAHNLLIIYMSMIFGMKRR